MAPTIRNITSNGTNQLCLKTVRIYSNLYNIFNLHTTDLAYPRLRKVHPGFEENLQKYRRLASAKFHYAINDHTNGPLLKYK